MRISVMLAFGVALGFPALAAAQDADPRAAAECLCVLPSEAGPRVATVQEVQGQVLVSGATGYAPVQSSTPLSAGDRVVLLDDGRAVLTGGECRVALAPDSTISLVPVDAGICVAQATTTVGIVPPLVPGQLPNSQLVGLLVGGGLVPAAIVGGVAAISEAPAPVSP